MIVDQQRRPQLLPPAGPRRFGGEDADPEFCPPQLAAGDGLELPEGIEAAAAVLKKSGHALDPQRIDVYQLGTLLCRLLSGEPVLRYMYDPRVKAKVPAIARSVLQRALGESAEEPFEDCQRLIRALEEAVRQADSVEAPSSMHETPARGSAVGVGSDTPPGGTPPASTPQAGADLPFERLGQFQIVGRIGRGMGSLLGDKRTFTPIIGSDDRDCQAPSVPPLSLRTTHWYTGGRDSTADQLLLMRTALHAAGRCRPTFLERPVQVD